MLGTRHRLMKIFWDDQKPFFTISSIGTPLLQASEWESFLVSCALQRASGRKNLIALHSQNATEEAFKSEPDLGLRKSFRACAESVLLIYNFRAETGQRLEFPPKAGITILGGEREELWFLYKNPSMTGRVAELDPGDKAIAFRSILANSETLLPEAMAIRNRVIRKISC